MRKVFLRIADALRTKYQPSPLRRAEVVQFLAKRSVLSHDEWHRRFAAPRGIPLDFVRWFREGCSGHFEYDLSAALPEDRLIEDLGMFDATWGDVDLDILEDYEHRYHTKLPQKGLEPILTFGQLLEVLWSHAKDQAQG
jgi:hypothetical protein